MGTSKSNQQTVCKKIKIDRGNHYHPCVMNNFCNSVLSPLVRANIDGAEAIHIRWVVRHRIEFHPDGSPFWQWYLSYSYRQVYRISRNGPLSQGRFGRITIRHILRHLASKLISVLGASIASSLQLASFSTPQLRHLSANADATAEWDSQAFSSERFE